MRTFTVGVAMAAAALGLAGCKGQGAAASSSAAPVSAASAQAAASAQPAAPAAAAIQVILTLSPAAAQALAAQQQTITLPAEIYGTPTDAALRDQLQGRLDLAPVVNVVVSGAGTANITVPALDQSKLAQVENGAAMVEIDISSGNHTTENNLLNCDAYMDVPLAQAEAQPARINCKLIGEP